jgi:hypothetical protein
VTPDLIAFLWILGANALPYIASRRRLDLDALVRELQAIRNGESK